MPDTSASIEALTTTINSLLQLQLRKEGAQDVAVPSTQQQDAPHPNLYNRLSLRIQKYAFGYGDETFEKWLDVLTT